MKPDLIEPDVLREMAALLDAEDRDEMAIPSYLHPNPALRWMAWSRIHAVVELIATCCPQGGSALDYGCGTGVLFESILRRADSLVGVDLVLDAARLWTERRGLSVDLIAPDAVADLPDRTMDLVVAAEVLEHVDDLDGVLRGFTRILKPGGTLLVSLPTESRAYRLGRRLAGFEGHYHHDNARSIDKRIRGLGYARNSRRQLPVPGPLAIYWVNAYSPPS